MSDRPCTCHPDDNPPTPCARKYALGECRAAELAGLRAENTTLRALLPKLGAPCAYCGLTEIAKCAHGFPGCPQADDLMAGEEEGWQETVKRMRAAEAKVGELRAAVLHESQCVEAAKEKIASLEADLATLIEDRARFPDRPDAVGRMIEAHRANLRAKADSHEAAWREALLRAEVAEAAARRRLELLEQAMFYIPDAPRNALTERAHALNDAIQAEMAKGKGS